MVEFVGGGYTPQSRPGCVCECYSSGCNHDAGYLQGYMDCQTGSVLGH